MEKGGSSRKRIARGESPPAASLPFPPLDATAHDDDLPARPARSSVPPTSAATGPAGSSATGGSASTETGSSAGGRAAPGGSGSGRLRRSNGPRPEPPGRGSSARRAAALADAAARRGDTSSVPQAAAEPLQPGLVGVTIVSPARPSDSSPPLHPFEIAKALRGEMLDHFLLEESVGVGGMGTVFRAKDTILNRIVAVKVLARDQAKDGETIRRFRNEAQSAARLDHPNIARVYYMGEARQVHYIVFEFIDGVNVRDLVNDGGPLPLDEALRTTLEMGAALAHASSRDVVHRDIKPSNIILTHLGEAKLVDMGLARLHEITPAGGDLTASGVTLGTFDYISPEQARDPRQVDVRGDLYSLGCTLFFMLTGRPPFPQGTVFQKLLQHQADAPPDPREFNPGVPAEVVRILRKMMAKDPAARHQTAEELVHEMSVCCRRLGIPLPGSANAEVISAEELQPHWWEVHLPWMAPVAALLAVVGLMEAMGAWSQPDVGALDRAFPLRPLAVDRAPRAGAPRAVVRSSQSPPAGGARESAVESGGNDVAAAPVETAAEIMGSAATAPSAAPESTPLFSGVPDAATRPAPQPAGSSGRGDEEKTMPGGPAPVGEGAGNASSSGGAGKTSAGSEPAGEGSGKTSSGGATETGSGGKTPAALPAAPAGAFAVVSADRPAQGFPTLAAACTAALSGDAVELRFNGRRQERPAAIENKSLTIRAADGFQPVLAFQSEFGMGREPGTRLFTVLGGRLVLDGLAVELVVPSDLTAAAWAVVRTQGRAGVELTNCSLTVQNNSGQLGAAFFEIAAEPGAEAMMMSNPDLPPPPPAQVRLRNCTARGDAPFLRAAELQPFDLDWEQGLLALGSAPVLDLGGGSMPAPKGMRNRCTLRRFLGDLRGGLARLEHGQTGQSPAPLSVECDQSVLHGRTGTPLFEQNGVYDPAEARSRQRLEWKSTQTLVENFSVWWRIAPMQAAVQDWGRPSWTSFWGEDERLAQVDAAPFRTPPPAETPAVADRTVEMYLLADPFAGRVGPTFAQLPLFPKDGRNTP